MVPHSNKLPAITRSALRPAPVFSRAALAALVVGFGLLSGSAHAQQNLSGCSTASEAQQARCQRMITDAIRASSQTTELAGGWRLVRIPAPGGGGPVSIMHAGDSARSDANFAGLTFRCSPAGIETILIVLQPLSKQSRPVVLVKNGTTDRRFDATVVQGGEALLLPREASQPAAADWSAARELAIEVAASPVPIRGVVQTIGLSAALQELARNCGKQ